LYFKIARVVVKEQYVREI